MDQPDQPPDPKPKKVYKGGQHATPRRKLPVSDARMARHREVMGRTGDTDWTVWANRVLDEYCDPPPPPAKLRRKK